MPVDTCSNVVGGTTRLECRVLGDPPPDIRWFKDGRDITHNRRFSFSSSADGDVSILIENISPRDEGYYRCRAENSEGFASTSAYLVVRGFRQHPDDVREQVYTMQVEDVLSSKGTSSTVSPIHIRKDADEAGQRRTFEQIVDEEKGGGRDGRLKINGKETSTKSSHTLHELTFAQSSTARELLAVAR
ncbi:immunoglobulin superfamily DCC subclass member 3-like [Pomacea canaliculata]|nr:immunoglobulin superfamily DCC subclass member 3-like [Pomacea canaliculata]XP_025086389.1 immunoglobulin superfamily DCC subclass member 3-like [Pomacea canaliculata]XP_025086397.1 immunoglobulin superfamily DCC subclass member 3-like [Pomacea canaliculata]